MDNKEILHKHLIQFELQLTELGIKGRIAFQEAMLKAMEEYATLRIKELKRKIDRL